MAEPQLPVGREGPLVVSLEEAESLERTVSVSLLPAPSTTLNPRVRVPRSQVLRPDEYHSIVAAGRRTR